MHKKGNKEHAENYRPICLLPVVLKVLEHYIFNIIRNHLFQAIHTSQHGFLAGKSCVTNLVDALALDYIGSCLHQGSQVDTIYLDMSKAFDQINHQNMLHKLANFDIGGNLLNWFHSYLIDRRVVVIGATSYPLPVVVESHKDHDLSEVITSSQVAMFVDDTKVFSSI